MTKEELNKFITSWNIRYPYDKRWREKHKIPLFSLKHREMTLADILLEETEDRLYKEAREEYLKREKQKEEAGVIPLRDREYIPGSSNWLSPSEDNMTEEEVDLLFDNIKI